MIFPTEGKKAMNVKFSEKGACLECNNWKDICVRGRNTSKLIDRYQVGFRPGSSCIAHINVPRIIEFREGIRQHERESDIG